jgi:hypothetical protein
LAARTSRSKDFSHGLFGERNSWNNSLLDADFGAMEIVRIRIRSKIKIKMLCVKVLIWILKVVVKVSNWNKQGEAEGCSLTRLC